MSDLRAATVDDLPAAWAFVMAKIDAVGPNPTVTITPTWEFSLNEINDDVEVTEHSRRFEAVVSGMVEEAPQS